MLKYSDEASGPMAAREAVSQQVRTLVHLGPVMPLPCLPRCPAKLGAGHGLAVLVVRLKVEVIDGVLHSADLLWLSQGTRASQDVGDKDHDEGQHDVNSTRQAVLGRHAASGIIIWVNECGQSRFYDQLLKDRTSLLGIAIG